MDRIPPRLLIGILFLIFMVLWGVCWVIFGSPIAGFFGIFLTVFFLLAILMALLASEVAKYLERPIPWLEKIVKVALMMAGYTLFLRGWWLLVPARAETYIYPPWLAMLMSGLILVIGTLIIGFLYMSGFGPTPYGRYCLVAMALVAALTLGLALMDTFANQLYFHPNGRPAAKFCSVDYEIFRGVRFSYKYSPKYGEELKEVTPKDVKEVIARKSITLPKEISLPKLSLPQNWPLVAGLLSIASGIFLLMFFQKARTGGVILLLIFGIALSGYGLIARPSSAAAVEVSQIRPCVVDRVARVYPGECKIETFSLDANEASSWILIPEDHYRFYAEEVDKKPFYIQLWGEEKILVKPDEHIQLPIHRGKLKLRFIAGPPGAKIDLYIYRRQV